MGTEEREREVGVKPYKEYKKSMKYIIYIEEEVEATYSRLNMLRNLFL